MQAIRDGVHHHACATQPLVQRLCKPEVVFHQQDAQHGLPVTAETRDSSPGYCQPTDPMHASILVAALVRFRANRRRLGAAAGSSGASSAGRGATLIAWFAGLLFCFVLLCLAGQPSAASPAGTQVLAQARAEGVVVVYGT